MKRPTNGTIGFGALLLGIVILVVAVLPPQSQGPVAWHDTAPTPAPDRTPQTPAASADPWPHTVITKVPQSQGSAVGHDTPPTPAPDRTQVAATEKMFDAFCNMNLRYIESAFDAANVASAYGRTTCRIVSYRQSLMILFTAEPPVFRIPAARKAWGLIAVSTAGLNIRDHGGFLFGVDYVGLTDSEQAKNHKAAPLPASYAEQLQAAVHDEKVEVADAMEDLDRRLHLLPTEQ